MESERGDGLDFFRNPLVGFIGTLTGIAGILLTLMFYLRGQEYRELTYLIHPTRAIVVSTGKASRLEVTLDGEEIKTDVSTAQVAVWNNGAKSIGATEILAPVILRTEGGVPILEVTIRKTTRTVTEFALGRQGLSPDRVALSWRILEANDGAVLQVVYAGSPTEGLIIEGIVEGQGRIEDFGKTATRATGKDIWIRTSPLGLLSGIILLILCIQGGRRLYGIGSDLVARRKVRFADAVVALVYLIGAAFAFHFVTLLRSQGPPLGF